MQQTITVNVLSMKDMLLAMSIGESQSLLVGFTMYDYSRDTDTTWSEYRWENVDTITLDELDEYIDYHQNPIGIVIKSGGLL